MLNRLEEKQNAQAQDLETVKDEVRLISVEQQRHRQVRTYMRARVLRVMMNDVTSTRRLIVHQNFIEAQ